MSEGRLVYLVGPSGAGKDSVLARLRDLLRPTDRLLVAHRYITRPADLGNENHVALTEAEFLQRREAGCFALHWQSHGLHYGIGREIEIWLAQGLSVVVNGSRAHAATLPQTTPRAEVVEITASETVIRQRLLARGREDATAIESAWPATAPWPTARPNTASPTKATSTRPLSRCWPGSGARGSRPVRTDRRELASENKAGLVRVLRESTNMVIGRRIFLRSIGTGG